MRIGFFECLRQCRVRLEKGVVDGFDLSNECRDLLDHFFALVIPRAGKFVNAVVQAFIAGRLSNIAGYSARVLKSREDDVEISLDALENGGADFEVSHGQFRSKVETPPPAQR